MSRPANSFERTGKRTGMRNALQIKIIICACIVLTAVILKSSLGQEHGISTAISGVINDGVDYKETIATLGRAVSGEQDVMSVFKEVTEDALSAGAIEVEDNSQQSDSGQDGQLNPGEDIQNGTQEGPIVETGNGDSAVDMDFYNMPVDTTLDEEEEKKLKAQQEQKEIELLSFQMSKEETADDTQPVPFTIPPPSYCSYDKLTINFKHVAPVHGPVTSPFGYRDHPIGGKASFHTGMDIAAAQGTTVQAFADGTVLEAAYNNTYGNYVLIEHQDGIRSFYGHNSKLNVKKGQSVKLGQKIAEVGTTGLSTGPHCHFEVRNSKNIRYDPKYYISPERI